MASTIQELSKLTRGNATESVSGNLIEIAKVPNFITVEDDTVKRIFMINEAKACHESLNDDFIRYALIKSQMVHALTNNTKVASFPRIASKIVEGALDMEV